MSVSPRSIQFNNPRIKNLARSRT